MSKVYFYRLGTNLRKETNQQTATGVLLKNISNGIFRFFFLKHFYFLCPLNTSTIFLLEGKVPLSQSLFKSNLKKKFKVKE